jgi:hypothetical protein
MLNVIYKPFVLSVIYKPFVLSVTYKPNGLSVIMVNVIMLNDVEPFLFNTANFDGTVQYNCHGFHRVWLKRYWNLKCY